MATNPVCEVVRAATGHDKALLSFSLGKDSWAAWLSARDYFDFTPYYLYLVPGLEFVQDYIGYAEQKLGKHIVQLPHPAFYRWINHATYQAPERLRTIVAVGWPDFEYDDIREAVIEDCGLPQDVWTATGVRAADSPMRRASLIKNQGVNAKRQYFYPCWDWKKEQLLTELVRADIKLPIDYKVFGRSFDGLDLRFLIKIKDVYGVATVYPANKVAEVFARIAGRKTLNADMLKAAAELGFQVKEQAPPITLRGFY